MELKIFHNGQFYVGIISFTQRKKEYFVQYVFGSNPNEEQIQHFIYSDLLSLIDNIKNDGFEIQKVNSKINPKRLQRKIAKEQSKSSYSTKSQEFLKQELEMNKKIKKEICKNKKEMINERKRILKRMKAKEKHKGK